MAIPLKFSKSEDSVPWGFRLVGGLDFDQPIVVVKVNENSLAEAAGLEVGDIIVRVNDISTAGLSHNEVHVLLFSAGCEFELGIRRGEIATNIIADEDYNIDESNAIMKAIEEEVFNEAVNVVNNMKHLLDTSVEEDINDEGDNLAGQEEVVHVGALKSTSDVKKGQTWSTFLVKPDKPVPKPKKMREREKPEDSGQYQVVIKKQSRRQSQEIANPSNNAAVTQIYLEAGQEAEVATQVDEILTDLELNIVESEEFKVIETETNGDCEFDTEETGQQENELERQNTRNSMETEGECSENLQTEENVVIAPSLEIQLHAIQKQLQALSKLPSAIQITLDAVSKQLASIVVPRDSVEHDRTSSSRDEEPETEEEFLEDTSASEKAEAELFREESEADSSSAEELEEDIVKQRGVEGDTEEHTVEHGTTPCLDLTEEEMEAQKMKTELEYKREKTMEQRFSKPIQRPIILPGGRKWSIPEDAIPSFRKPKMSDEKIVEAIEGNLEVIIGKRKGMPFSSYISRATNCWMVSSKVVPTTSINFLKYQPPPKNLDYLQKSEVYRLIHDKEPPLKGITSRAEKVPAVQDYYEANKGVP